MNKIHSIIWTSIFGLTACSDSSFKGNAAAHVISADNSGNAGANAQGNNPGSGDKQASSGDPSAGSNGHGSGTQVLPPPPPPPNINFGMMVANLDCTFCHVEVHGTVASIGDVAPLREDSYGKIFGKWLASGAYNATAKLTVPPVGGGIVVTGGVTPNYNNSGKELPVDKANAPAFPALDFTKISSHMQGSLTSRAAPSSVSSIAKVYNGNVLLVGTAASPIVINRDILVAGDVVIKGIYSGVGTIYATGNIYIPANLKAAHLASFPYSDDPKAANTQAAADLKAGNKDALGLAAAKSIFIGDLENYMDSANGPAPVAAGLHGVRYHSIYTITAAPDPLNETVNGVWNVYSWLPEAQFEQLYENGTACWTNSNRAIVAPHVWGERTFTEIDAYMYAGDVIGGIDRATSWTINGGMISQAMHIVSGAGSDRVAAVNAQGAPANCAPSRINFDYRMQNGLQVLEQLGALIPTK